MATHQRNIGSGGECSLRAAALLAMACVLTLAPATVAAQDSEQHAGFSQDSKMSSHDAVGGASRRDLLQALPMYPPTNAAPPFIMAFPPLPSAYPPSPSAFPPSPSAYPPAYAPMYPPPYPPAYPPPAFNPLPPGTMENAPTTQGSVFYVGLATLLSLSSDGCTAAGSNPEQFMYGFAQSVMTGFNSLTACTVDGNCIQLGDVTNIVPSGTCFSRKLRSLLQSSTATVDANVNMPPGVSEEQAAVSATAFSSAVQSEVTSGTFADQFGVTDATVDVKDPVALETDDDDNSLALGLGLGLGLGIPVVIAIVVGVVLMSKRRKYQPMNQSSA